MVKIREWTIEERIIIQRDNYRRRMRQLSTMRNELSYQWDHQRKDDRKVTVLEGRRGDEEREG